MTDKKQEEKKEQPKKQTRQIIIETDGNQVRIIKADVAGKIELSAILQTIISNIDKL
jgi:translation initiation factor IF-2